MFFPLEAKVLAHLRISVPDEPARRAFHRRNHKMSVSCTSEQPEREAELMEYHYQGHCRRQLFDIRHA